MNVDVEPLKSGGVIDAIIIDFKGSVVSRVNKVPYISNPVILEAKDMLDGLKLAKSYNLQKIQIEGNANIIVDSISKNNLGPLYLQMLIKDIRDMSRKFIVCSFPWTPREGNQAAHILASFGKSLDYNKQ